MNKKNIILQTIVFTFLCIVSFAEEKQKPNVVFIIVDDLNAVSYTHLTLPTILLV